MIKKLSSKGQLVLPATYRRKLGLVAGSAIRIREDGERLVLEPAGRCGAEFVASPGMERPIISLRSKRTFGDGELMDPLDDDA
jgi:AbrB family looped-hinge helix DNA binding protein